MSSVFSAHKECQRRGRIQILIIHAHSLFVRLCEAREVCIRVYSCQRKYPALRKSVGCGESGGRVSVRSAAWLRRLCARKIRVCVHFGCGAPTVRFIRPRTWANLLSRSQRSPKSNAAEAEEREEASGSITHRAIASVPLSRCRVPRSDPGREDMFPRRDTTCA